MVIVWMGWIVIKEPSGGRVLSGNGGIHRSLQITHLHNKLEGGHVKGMCSMRKYIWKEFVVGSAGNHLATAL